MQTYTYQVIVNRTLMHERTIRAYTMGEATSEMNAFCAKVGGTHTIGPIETGGDDEPQ